MSGGMSDIRLVAERRPMVAVGFNPRNRGRANLGVRRVAML